jgi:threonine dehydrogenase-like Zn-dependent dehydrogenase
MTMGVTMRAVELTPQGVVLREDYPLPVERPGEVRIRVTRAGVCDTDLQLIRGYMRFQGVLGHEFVGVAESGPWSGRRVVGEINCSCHACATCRSGLPNHCPHRTVLGILGRDGAFAEYVVLPQRNLHLVPDHVSDDQAVFVEPLAAAFQIPSQVLLTPRMRVLVLGDGRLGQLCARVLALSRCRLTVIGKHPAKLALLRDCGIDAALRGEIVPDRSADVVVDATGSASGVEDAFGWLKPRGTLVLKTTIAGRPPLSLAAVVVDELHVIGSRCGPFPPAIAALADGTIDVEPLIQARYPLAQALQALDRANAQPVLKVLLEGSNGLEQR